MHILISNEKTHNKSTAAQNERRFNFNVSAEHLFQQLTKYAVYVAYSTFYLVSLQTLYFVINAHLAAA